MVQTFGEMPANPDFPLPESARDRVSHALLKVGETDLMFSDTFPGQPVESSNQVQICIMTDAPEHAKRYYARLKVARWLCRAGDVLEPGLRDRCGQIRRILEYLNRS